jgi:hypothetical protein
VAATNPYCSLAQAKLVTGINDQNDDALLDMAIGAASRQIDGYVGYRFWVDSTVQTREYVADDYACITIEEGISTATGLVVAIDEDGDGTYETTLTIGTDFVLKPTNAADSVPALPYTEIVLVDNYAWPIHPSGRPGVQVTAAFGWPAVPADVVMACALLTHDLFKAKDAPFGVAGAADFGALRITTNRTVLNLLAPYRKVSIG